MTYSRTLINRLICIVCFFTFSLVVVFTLSRILHFGTTLSERYTPLERVTRIEQMISSIFYKNNILSKKNTGSQYDFDMSNQLLLNAVEVLDCNHREKYILFNDFEKILSKVPVEERGRAIGKIVDITKVYSRINCAVLINDSEFIHSLKINVFDKDIKIKKFITSLLTEDFRWFSKSHCVYSQGDNEKIIYLSGGYNKCLLGRKNVITHVGYHGGRSLKKIADVLEKPAIKSSHVVKGSNSIDYKLTLDPSIQSTLDEWGICLIFEKKNCNKDLYIKRSFSLVIADANNGDILGIKCVGEKCTQNGLIYLGDLAALQVMTPPASIAKILFALAIASDTSIKPDELMLQLKTSGSFSNSSGKRNEWWERQAICDYKEENGSCSTINRTRYYADMLGFSTTCSNSKIFGKKEGSMSFSKLSCGESIIARDGNNSGTTPKGFLGYIPIDENLHLNKSGVVEFMKWRNYNNIRKNREKVLDSTEYLNTSTIVQSSIGGGNSRISALGIASIMTGTNLLGKGIYPKHPSVLNMLRKENYKDRNFLVPFEDRMSANIVIEGLRKVLTPSERGWIGSGTASTNFKNIFGKTCDEKCPIFGKTGTVSSMDLNFKNVSLFGGVTQLDKLQLLLGKDLRFSKYKNIAIGIISYNDDIDEKRITASNAHMRIINNLFFRNENNGQQF